MEYLWSYWKQHELPNVCPQDYWEDQHARRALRRMRRRPRLITAFCKIVARMTLYYARLNRAFRVLSRGGS